MTYIDHHSAQIPLASGDEEDFLTRARRFYSRPAGRVKRIKRYYQRRLRQAIRKALRREAAACQ